MPGEEAWVTLATNDSYSLGAIVLARSLRRANTTRQLVVMITPGVSAPMRDVLNGEFDSVVPVNILDSEDSANLALLSRPELGITFTKLHCWRLTQYTKCVFLDADTLVLQSCDELFEREEFSAAPDSGWPDCFNSGVFVFRPSLDTYTKLLEMAVTTGSFDGGDQGLLNLYYSDWSVTDISKHLPFIYNVCASATYSYLPAYRVFGQNAKIVHFIGQAKPWLQFFDTETGTVRAPEGQTHLQELLQAWWDIFKADVHHKLTSDMDGESATVVEQVQSSVSHIFAPPPHHEERSPPPAPHWEPEPQPEHQHSAERISYEYLPYDLAGFQEPDLSRLQVAIQRLPPENVLRAQAAHARAEMTGQRGGEHNEKTGDRAPPPSPRAPPPPPPSTSHQSVQKDWSAHLPAGNCSTQSWSEDDDSRRNWPPEPPDHQSSPSDPPSESAGLAGAFAKMSLEGQKSGEQLEAEEMMRKHAWEQGHIDYLGKDSFDNILKKIQASLATAQGGKTGKKSPSPPKPPTSTPQPEAESVSVQESIPAPEVTRPAPDVSAAPLSPGPPLAKTEIVFPSPSPAPEIENLSIQLPPAIEPVVEALSQDAPPPPLQQSVPQGAPQAYPQSVPQGDAQSVPQTDEQAVPQADTQSVPQGDEQSVPQGESQSAAQADAQSVPQADPKSVPQEDPQTVPKEEPQLVPQSEPQGEPQSAPQGDTQSAPQEEPEVVPQGETGSVAQGEPEVVPQGAAQGPPPTAETDAASECSEVVPPPGVETKPVEEASVVKAAAAVTTGVVPAEVGVSSPPEVAPAVESVDKTAEEAEDERLTRERQAVEKKLAEQKRSAELKLEEEKRAVAEGKLEARGPPAPAAETAEEVEAPKAPPRKQSKVSALSLRTLGVGLSCVVMLAFAIYTSSWLSTKSDLL